MSYIVSAACVRIKAPGVAKNVLMQLADIANDDGFAWPSLETLCMRTCWGRTAVIEAIAWLEQSKAIRADRSNGRKTTYWLTPTQFLGDRFPELSTGGNRAASRTGVPVRQTDLTRPPNGPNPSAKRTLITKNHQEPDIPLPPDGGRAGFDDNFWSLYPRRVDEQLARKAWAQIAPSPDLQRQIADAVKAWAQHDEWQRESGRFVPKPHRWLARKRWTDVPGRADAPASVDEAARTRAMLDAQAAAPTLPASEVKRRVSELRQRMRQPADEVAA
jgi:hypothetical protein